MIDRMIRVGALLDCYGPLLTKIQREQCELHFNQDYSLAEIAEMYNVSRQAVYDAITRAENALEEFEKQLGMIKKASAQLETLTRVAKNLSSSIDALSQEQKNQEQVKSLKKAKEEVFGLMDDLLGVQKGELPVAGHHR